MIRTETGLSEEVISLLTSVFKEFPKIQEVIVFGSRAKGDFHTGSDIDLAVKTVNMTYSEMQQVKLAIDNLNLLYKIDLVDINRIDNQDLLDHIKRVGVALYPV